MEGEIGNYQLGMLIEGARSQQLDTFSCYFHRYDRICYNDETFKTRSSALESRSFDKDRYIYIMKLSIHVAV